MDDLVKTARRAKGSDLLPKVSFGTMNAETLILRMADRIEELEAEVARLREALEVFADDRNWFDATEDNIRYPAWRGPVDEPEEFARATLAEKEKSDD